MDVTYLAQLSADIIAKCVVLAGNVMNHWVMGTSTLALTSSGHDLVWNVANAISGLVHLIAMFLA